MPTYQSRGVLPQKRYTYLRRPGGLPYYEHLITAEGFDAEASILYRLRSPTTFLRFEPSPSPRPMLAQQPFIPNMLCRVEHVADGGDFLQSRRQMYCNDALTFSIAKPDRRMDEFYRNAAADELIVVVQGSGLFQSVYGDIRYGELDVIYVPRGDIVQWSPNPGPQIMAIVESEDPFRIPAEYRKANGQFHEHAPYHERDIRTPQWREPIDQEGQFPVVIRVGDDALTAYLDHHPFDVVGWDGYSYPWAVNLRDYEPRSGRISLLPNQYMLMSTAKSMVSCITPRRLADHPDATAMQPFHQNLDYDEILYRFSGSTGLSEPGGGTFTLHPRGIGHGPKPGFETMPQRASQDAWGLMVDTRLTLKPSKEAARISDASYVDMMVGRRKTAATA